METRCRRPGVPSPLPAMSLTHQITPSAICRGTPFLNGFAVVKWRSAKADSSDPRARYRCIHHGDESKNWRDLEQHVEGDDAGNILSQRKRVGTFVYKFACKWMVYVALKPVHYGATTKVWTIGISSLDHSHALVANPLSYVVHLKVLPELQLALAAAVSHRFAVISWSASNRILDHLGLGLTRTQKQHGRVDARGLTGAEMAVRAANTIEQAAKRGVKGGRSGIPPCGGVSGWNYHHCGRCDTYGDIYKP
jgi:hypothetical protein